MNESSVGDVMTEGRVKAIRTIAIAGGMFVYLGSLLYSASHNWNLLVNGVQPDLRAWAALGVVALEVTGAILPLAIHFWTHDALQRIAALVFYVVNLLLIAGNMIVDYAGVTGAILPAWLGSYRLFVLPAIPILCAAGWSLLFLLDPHSRELALIEGLKASTREVLAKRIAAQARAAEITAEVDQAAEVMTRDVIAQVLGASMRRTAPAGVIDITPKDAPKPSGNGKHAGVHAYNAETEQAAAELEYTAPKQEQQQERKERPQR